MARMDEKTWKEAVDDAHARPWWADALIAEARRARESEARLAKVLAEHLDWYDGGRVDEGKLIDETRAALTALEDT